MPLRHAAMLEVNEFLVLDYVRDQGRTSRPEIARALDLSPASVSRIVGRLLRDGVVVEDGRSGPRGGRPAASIRFNPRAGAVLAVDLGAESCHGAVADLAGELLYEEVRPTRQHGSAFDTLLAVIDDLLGEAGRQHLALAALAVGVPAIIDPETGAGIAGPSVEWQRFEIVASLRARVDIPFVVENDVNLAALAQAWRGEARHVADYFTFHLGHGVGGAIVANGRLVKGRHNAGGEIGYLVLDRAQLGRPGVDGAGPLESVLGIDSILARYAAAIGSAGGGRDGARDVHALVQAARGGEPAARAIVDDVVAWVQMAILAVSAVADPELIVLDGRLGRALEPFVTEIVRGLAAVLPRPPRVIASRLAGNATLVGAIAAALQLAREEAAPKAAFGSFATAAADRRDAT